MLMTISLTSTYRVRMRARSVCRANPKVDIFHIAYGVCTKTDRSRRLRLGSRFAPSPIGRRQTATVVDEIVVTLLPLQSLLCAYCLNGVLDGIRVVSRFTEGCIIKSCNFFQLYSIMEMKPPISKAKMTAITRNAIKAIKLYKHVVQCVEKFIQKVN